MDQVGRRGGGGGGGGVLATFIPLHEIFNGSPGETNSIHIL